MKESKIGGEPLRSSGRTLGIMAISLGIFTVGYNQWWMFPVRLFVTTLHESGHAFFCLITGGHVSGLRIFADGSGVTMTRGGLTLLVLSGGYLGSAFFGACILRASTHRSIGRYLHHILATVLVAMTMLFARSLFTATFMLLTAAALSAGVGRLSLSSRQNFFLGLGTVTGMTALGDIRMLFLGHGEGTVGGKPMLSDAQALAQLSHIPALFWALLWGIVALIVLYRVTLKTLESR